MPTLREGNGVETFIRRKIERYAGGRVNVIAEINQLGVVAGGVGNAADVGNSVKFGSSSSAVFVVGANARSTSICLAGWRQQIEVF